MIEADIPYLDTHLNIALSLYVQRLNCINQAYVEASVQSSIEKRLLIHLHVLSHSIDNSESEPKTDADLFVYVSRRLLSINEELQKEILIFSKQLIIEYKTPKGLIDALILFYSDDIDKLLRELFDSHKELRSVIITIWHYCNQQIPIGLLNQSELQYQDHELQQAVLAYNAEQESVGQELFQSYYRSLIQNVKKEDLNSNIIHVSLWGGMLRHDKDVLKAIRRAIELESNSEEREKYLRLAALDGNEELLPIFTSVSESKPKFGSYLISLLGTTESIKFLFSMLQNPKISIFIIPAWQQITGQKLKTVPRISLVDNKSVINSESDEADSVPLIADIESAQLWAKKYVSKWEMSTRYIHGMKCNQENLIKLSYQFSGGIGKDIVDLLALSVNKKLTLKPEFWISNRYEILDEISKDISISSDK